MKRFNSIRTKNNDKYIAMAFDEIWADACHGSPYQNYKSLIIFTVDFYIIS